MRITQMSDLLKLFRRTSEDPVKAKFAESPKPEVGLPRIPILRTRVNKGEKRKGRSPATMASGSSDPMREAGALSTEVVVAEQSVPAPPGVVMVAPQTLLSNASTA